MLHKKRLFLLTLGLAAALSALQPAVPALADAWERNGTGSYVGSDGSVLTGITARGIDVSSRQQNINWNAVAADDVSFVMLGCRYNNTADPSFGSYALGAYNAGIRVGAYLYSYATTTAMAEQEADFVLNLIKDYPISYPVVLDVESEQMSALTPSALADVINAFCRKIENAGYYPMIYTNDYWLTNKIDMSKVHYDVWVARFNAKPAYQNAAMWQATNQGQVNGITGAVDINFSLKDFTDKLPANRWRLIGGNWYYYKNYVKQTGWVNDGQSWYYQNQDGTQYKGWLLLNNQYYYLLPSTGQMQTGWVQIDNTWYYLKQDGTMATEWLNVDNKWYYLLNGAMVTGWLRIGTDYYYLRGDGSMVTGWRLMDGAYYYFNTDGRLVRGWADIDGERYFFRTDGTMVTGWQTIDNLLYYFDPEGGLATKWEQIDGSWYYFGTDGRMMTGWIQVDGRYYYLNTDGKMVTGWQSDGTNWYYMDPSSGKMAVGWKQINGSWYYFNQSGHMITGWLLIDGKYYYLNPADGKMVANGSYVINNVNYTFNQDGVCLNESSMIDGGAAGSVYTSPSGTAGTGNITTGNTAPGNTGVPGTSTMPGNSSMPGSSTMPGNSSMPGNSYPGGSTGSVTTVNPGGTNNMGTSMTPGNTGMSGNSGYYGQNGMQAGMTAGPGNTNTGSTSYPGNTGNTAYPGNAGNTAYPGNTSYGAAYGPGYSQNQTSGSLPNYSTGAPGSSLGSSYGNSYGTQNPGSSSYDGLQEYERDGPS